MKTVRTIASCARALGARAPRARPDDGRVPRGPPLADPRRPRRERHVVVSLFVNPAQFGQRRGPRRAIPRDEARDAALAEDEGVDFLFAPPPEEMYPPGFQTWVEVEELSKPLEGAFRPGHFRGVATVCLKLFNIVRPQRAYFGQKDAQQVAVLQRMVRDLDLDLEIRVLPTVREARRARALVAQRVPLRARSAPPPPLPRALETRDPQVARALLNGLDVDYVEVADFEPRVLAAAVRIGETRLIDNVVLEEGAST